MSHFAVVDAGRVSVPEPDPLIAPLLYDGILPVAAVRDVDPGTAPPEIRTVSGLMVFVSAVQRAELERWCADEGIAVRRRPDVWGDLLEPYLDTEFTDRMREITDERLSARGLGPEEVADIRERVAPLMIIFNDFLWDEYHLGLCDLLDALGGDVIPEAWADGRSLDVAAARVRLMAGFPDHAAFVAWAMRIADLGYAANATGAALPPPR
ncbi:hypothetical protein [Yinghuangia soli]|uniref:Uncharacterized protein n=1 Tax=Yinghuangia soli TaxID=2908204 RepID=A0AA41TYL6_9ACTN|nr:hypothetical protein [Yinghuangia soli]MCF2526516.1 hypothetical protein [Yinghuangia soli]